MGTVTINRLEQPVREDFIFSVDQAIGLKGIEFLFYSPFYGEDIIINWGDGTIDTINIIDFRPVKATHNYLSSYTGDIIVNTPSNRSIASIESGSEGIDISSNINVFNTLTELQSISFNKSCKITGNLENLNLTELNSLRITGSNTISGDIENLLINSNINTLTIYGFNTLTGNILGTKNSSIRSLDIRGSNTISGDIENIGLEMNSIILFGSNTLTGDIKNLHSDLNKIEIIGSNTIFGDISTLKQEVANLTIKGNNTISGNIQDIPYTYDLLTNGKLEITGSNTISGDISLLTNNMPTDILIISGNNTVSGNINLVYQKISNSSSFETNFNISGNNTMDLNLANINPTLRNITVLNSNAIVGNLKAANLSETSKFRLSNCDNISYSGNTNWSLSSNSIVDIELNVENPTNIISSEEIDQFLIDLDSYSFLKNRSSLSLTGGFFRTSNSNNAFNNLTSDGMLILIN